MRSKPESSEAVAARLRPHLEQAEAARRSALGSTIVLGGVIALWALARSYDAWQAASFPWTVGWSALGAVGVWYVQKWSKPKGATGKSLIVLNLWLTLNQRVPGSSPGAPTKPFKI
jgi:hypothetical protein